MPDLLNSLTENPVLTGELHRDVATFLSHHGLPNTAAHCADVAAEAKSLARRFGEDSLQAEAAGLLHDISAVFPWSERVIIARQLGVDVLSEEEAFPMIIHQKLSVVIASQIFGVTDLGVLSAIGCHTTLKAAATRLDKVVFIADKIAWDQPGSPPYVADVLAGLEKSLDVGVMVYLQYLWNRRETLRVVHPWFVAAYQDLRSRM